MAFVAKVVTGYIEIPDHPRDGTDYRMYGEKLLDFVKPYEAFVFDDPAWKPEYTWLAQQLRGAEANITHSVADNPEKNTRAYHCVQHQKFRWLMDAMTADTENPADIYVWIDYGILRHMPDVTQEIIHKFLVRAEDFAFVTMPGCWPKRQDIDPDQPCWRFCGGLIAVPRPLVKPFVRMVSGVALKQIQLTQNIEWEVNSLARLELIDQVPIAWYHADHNKTMFTGAL